MSEYRRILLVEDDPRDLELTLMALKDHHLVNEVQVARDGEEALDILFHRSPFEQHVPGNPAVVLLDLKLPKVDGIEVLRQIRADEHLKLTPVVVLTSSREERDLIQTYRLGVNAYIVKPVNFGEFIAAVKAIGMFWMIVNEAPPGSIRGTKRSL